MGKSRSRSRSDGRWGDPDPDGRGHRADRRDGGRSHRSQSRERRGLPPPPLSLAPPPVGSIHRGTVHTVRPFGIFVALPGYKRHVMVHNTQVSDELRFTREDDDEAKVKALEFYFPRGEQVWVKVMEVTPDDRNPAEMRVNGSMRAVDQATGTDLDPNGLMAAAEQHGGGRGRGGPETDEPPEAGTVHRAVVKRIEAYGVFVALEGYRRHGLVHTSQVSNYLSFSKEDSDEQKKAELAGVVTVGEQIWVKVVEVTADEARGGYKIGCSIKLVSQADGEDLDPAMTRYKPRDAAGRGAGGGVVGSTVGEVGRGGKIDWGHLAGDTKLYVNEKAAAQYKLLEEEPPPRAPQPGPPGQGRGGPGIPGLGAGISGLPPPSAPAGRGRGMVLPAWMTQGGGAGAPPAPGSLPGPPPGPSQHQPAPTQLPASSKFELKGVRDVDPASMLLDLVGAGAGGAAGGQRISSIEEALAILEAHGGGRSSKKKDKKKSKKDKGKDKKKGKKSRGRDRRRSRSSSGSSSDSDSDGGRRR
ncbi:hypothetical protein GPECTOR_19g334 [Gonium pectorale]|uniref:S1 motif domain-containing protein n=1 Tax=Gonium pectorale TaxID=33097 RepID=A0A150GJ97_GONPE|nr:hypothetical protein GPECTOR_19g334 [Gonium pectorale]|eukprot:KXZ49883.1 hypothetical protein GPECTOR_19g334 [Gonium pectorale]